LRPTSSERIVDDLQNSLQLAGEQVLVPIPYTIYPKYFAEPDPYSIAIHEFLLFVNQASESVRNLLSISHRIIEGPG
jgi:hypothetical protein